MRDRELLFLLVVFFLIFVVGCENNLTGSDMSLDKEAIKDYILNNPDFAEYFTFDEYYGKGDTVTRLRTITGPKIWYREPQDINRDISINIVNDSAFVSFWGSVKGLFHVLERDTSIDHQKNLDDNSSNYAIFKHYDGLSTYRGWRLESLTGVDVIGLDHQKGDCVVVWIDSIRINCESYSDTLFVTPQVFFEKEELLTFEGQEEVTLTLYSNYDIYSYLHAHSLGSWRRWSFTEEIEPGVWQGEWITPLISGVRAVAFDALSKTTIDEEDSPYESNIWIFPYKIK